MLEVLRGQPADPSALEVAGLVVLLDASGSAARFGEKPLRAQLANTRLDPIFCACEQPGCRRTWISPRLLGPAVPGTTDYTVYSCSRCGGQLDSAPEPNGCHRRPA